MQSFKGKSLWFNGKEIHFVHEIKDVREIPNGCLVLVKWSFDGPNRNVFFVAEDGAVKWQIQDYAPQGSDLFCPYGGFVERGGEVWIYSTVGMDCKIDFATGEIIDRVMVK